MTDTVVRFDPRLLAAAALCGVLYCPLCGDSVDVTDRTGLRIVGPARPDQAADMLHRRTDHAVQRLAQHYERRHGLTVLLTPEGLTR